MDALGTTLGTVALFAPLFNACKKFRHHYKLTRTFGEDFLVVQRHIDTQYARLEQLSKRPLRDLVGYERIDVQDEHDPTMKKVISILAEMREHSDRCIGLIARYHGSRTHAATLEPANPTASPYPATPTSINAPSGTDPREETSKPEKKRRLRIRLPRGNPRHPTLSSPAPAPGGLVQPSVLNTAEVNEELERQRSEAATMQSSTPFLRRISWAISDRPALTELAEALRRGNNDIESLLVPPPMEESALLLRANRLTGRLSVTVDLVKRALGRLHEALKKLNTPIDTFHHGDGQRICQLSVQLREDTEVNRRQLQQEPNVHLRNDSYVFNIQRQENKDPKSAADLLFVETLKNPQAALETISDDSDAGSSITELHDLSLPPITGEGVETLGFFRGPPSRDNIHVLFRDKSKRLYSPLHLADIVSSSDYRDYMNPIQLVQLVRLVLRSYLFFSTVRDSLDTNARLINFRYFCRAGEQATQWDIEKPLVLRPWLSFGFGSPRRYNLGEDQGPESISSPSLIQLGLVLYQICVGEVMEYGAGAASVTRAKQKALKELNRVDKAVGSTLTEIVRVLLSPTRLVAAGEKIGENEETEYILNAITTLITYEEKIEGTMTDAEKEAPAPTLDFNPESPVTSNQPTLQAVAGAVDNNGRDLQ